MADNVRFGIVGLGMGHHRATQLLETEGAELVAVCDIWEERGEKAQQELGVPWVKDYGEFLQRDDIDAVGVFTPSGMHCEFCSQALAAGKHCFTTKPMDIRLSAVDAAIAVAEEQGLVFGVDFESRYNAVNHQIRNALQGGALGKIVFADLRMKWFRGQGYYTGGMPEGWRMHLETEGGSFANQAVHYVDLLQWWLGPVKSITGRKGTFAHQIETEDASMSLIEFTSGTMGVVLTTTCSLPDLGTAIEITGTHGTIAWKDQDLTVFQAAKEVGAAGAGQAGYTLPELAPNPEVVDLEPENFAAPADLPQNIFADMARAITKGAPLQCDAYEGRKTVELIESLYRSSAQGEPVVINE
jgi:predicted dehydrogenase